MRENDGFALIITILLFTLITAISTTMTLGTILNFELAHNMASSRRALYGAEGGIDLIQYLLFFQEEEGFQDLNSALDAFLQLETVKPYLKETSPGPDTASKDLTQQEGRRLLLKDQIPIHLQVAEETPLTVYSKSPFPVENYRGIKAVYERREEDLYTRIFWQEIRDE